MFSEAGSKVVTAYGEARHGKKKPLSPYLASTLTACGNSAIRKFVVLVRKLALNPIIDLPMHIQGAFQLVGS